MSAAPRLTISNASPIAWAEAEQAVQGAELGPFAPNRIDTWPAARLMIAEGMKKGEILRGPPSSSARCSRSIVLNPPMPEAMKTPTRGPSGWSVFSPASHRAKSDAAMAYWDKDVHFLDVFLVDEREWVEPLDFAGYLRREVGRVETSDATDPTPAGAQPIPGRLGSNSQR